MSRTQRTWSLVVALALVAAARPAVAQDRQTIKKILDLNRVAMEDYDLTDFEAAKKKLTEALLLGKRGKLARHRAFATTNLNLGIVYGAGLRDADNAKLYFMAAIEIDPEIQLPAAYRDPALKRLLEDARAGLPQSDGDADGEGGSEPSGDDEGDDRRDSRGEITGLQHDPISEAKARRPIRITARMGKDLKAKEVLLYYRPDRLEDFVSVPMERAGKGTLEAEIPGDATTGDYVHYYIEAQNERGRRIATRGSAGSPNVIDIIKPARERRERIKDDDVDEEDPLASGGKGRSRQNKSSNEADDEAEAEPEAEPEAEAEIEDVGRTARKKAVLTKHTLYTSVGVGSGIGYVTGQTEQAMQPVQCCVASSPLHVMVELGFWLNPKMTVSAYGRIGFPLGANMQGHATAAPAGFLRLTYALGSGPVGEGLALHGDLGGGFIRHTISLDAPQDPGQNTDTVVSGPLFVGGGMVWSKRMGGPFRFVADANLELGIPIMGSVGAGSGKAAIKPQFVANLDINLGLLLVF